MMKNITYLVVAVALAGCALVSDTSDPGDSPYNRFPLTIGNTYSRQARVQAPDLDVSYYKFSTGSLTDVLLTVTGSVPSHNDTGDYVLDFGDSSPVTHDTWFQPTDSGAVCLTGLTQNTTYYFDLTEYLRQKTTYQIAVSPLPPVLHEGSWDTPLPLSAFIGGTSTTPMVVTNHEVPNGGSSLYSFVAPQTGTITISYPSKKLTGLLWDAATLEDVADTNGSIGVLSSFEANVVGGHEYRLSFDSGDRFIMTHGSLVVSY